MQTIGKIDNSLIAIIQWAYDFVLDLFGWTRGSFNIIGTIVVQMILNAVTVYDMQPKVIADVASGNWLLFFVMFTGWIVLTTFCNTIIFCAPRSNPAGPGMVPYSFVKLERVVTYFQLKGSYRAINAMATQFLMNYPLRLVRIGFILFVGVLCLGLVGRTLWPLVIGFILTEYMLCIRVRDRIHDRFSLRQDDLAGSMT